jgi:hypothetical protein
MPDISHAFSNAVGQPSLLKNINPGQDDLAALREARGKIRVALIASIEDHTQKKENGGKKITPKFWLQGSLAYNTLNAPAHLPPQEMDCDYGVYLPMRFHQQSPPAAAARSFFDLVESTLTNLVAKEKDWKLDSTKRTCVRVSLGKKTHIDLPLYAVPEEGYQKLITEAAKRLDSSMIKIATGTVNDNKWAYDLDEVHLALRNGTWLQSDPIKIREWFENKVNIHGDELVRLCRYLKAWRDWRWKEKGPTSICLMAGVVETFEQFSTSEHQRLLTAATGLVQRFKSGTISNPDGGGENLLSRLNAGELALAIQYLEQLQSQVTLAMDVNIPARSSHDLMRQEFGPRFPGYYEDKSTPIRDIVTGTPAQATTSLRIPSRNTSGKC